LATARECVVTGDEVGERGGAVGVEATQRQGAPRRGGVEDEDELRGHKT
jgi:hypothetical protein